MEKSDSELLKKILEKIEFIAKQYSYKLLEEELSNKKLKLLYQHTGKGIPRPKLEKVTGLSAGKISGIWAKWESKGLLKKDGKSYYKIFE
ncbi:MAG: hypothetical protein Q7S92_03900 [Candidatus Diapherotrites archaeon]|nr:hypothetical protein [Candidatus Diapherotrites archaeon]